MKENNMWNRNISTGIIIIIIKMLLIIPNVSSKVQTWFPKTSGLFICHLKVWQEALKITFILIYFIKIRAKR